MKRLLKLVVLVGLVVLAYSLQLSPVKATCRWTNGDICGGTCGCPGGWSGSCICSDNNPYGNCNPDTSGCNPPAPTSGGGGFITPTTAPQNCIGATECDATCNPGQCTNVCNNTTHVWEYICTTGGECTQFGAFGACQGCYKYAACTNPSSSNQTQRTCEGTCGTVSDNCAAFCAGGGGGAGGNCPSGQTLVCGTPAQIECRGLAYCNLPNKAVDTNCVNPNQIECQTNCSCQPVATPTTAPNGCVPRIGCSANYPGFSYTYTPADYPTCSFGPPWPNSAGQPTPPPAATGTSFGDYTCNPATCPGTCPNTPVTGCSANYPGYRWTFVPQNYPACTVGIFACGGMAYPTWLGDDALCDFANLNGDQYTRDLTCGAVACAISDFGNP